MICVVVPVTIIINTVAVIIIWQKKKEMETTSLISLMNIK